MDFFASQDKARRNTKLLVVYFICAVIGITAALYLVIWGALAYASEGRSPHLFRPELLLITSGLTVTIITAGSLYKTLEMRRGGEYIAQTLGGRRIPPNTNSLHERRLLNIVEEMALASGIPAPPVYVLDGENSINAFAAGRSPADAVIGVNRGTIEYLSRDELQGVIAHEYSHILNGDMRMNLRLIGVLHGILLISIIGYYMMRVRSSSSRDKGGGWLVLVGLGAYLVGSIGLLFGRLIKAAISRQREYLADASAVQFTRNPDGIAGALKKIGGLTEGSRVKHPEAETASHMFFSNALGSKMAGWLSTHPPLVERIRRIDPQFTGKFGAAQRAPIGAEEQDALVSGLAVAGHAQPVAAADKLRIDPRQAIESVGTLSAGQIGLAAELVSELPRAVHEAVHEPFSARNVAFALLLDDNPELAARQLAAIRKREGAPSADETECLRPLLDKASVGARLPIMEIIQGTLRSLSPVQYNQFRSTVEALVAADERTSMFEFILQRMLLEHLDRFFHIAPEPQVRFHTWSDTLALAASDLLAVVAHAGAQDAAEAAHAYQLGLELLRKGRPEILARERCTVNVVDRALARLAAAAPQLKKTALAALLTAAGSDREITVQEAELLRALADSMDCPLPPLHNLLASTSTTGV